MKISKFAIVSAVVFLHVAAISLMIVQPGCKSSSSKTATTPEAVPVPAVAANADTTLPAPPSAPAFVPPSRPETPVVPVTIATLNGGSEPPPSSSGINAIAPENATPTQVTYVVKNKDNMTSIAKANGVSLRDLESANPKVDPRKMKAGDVLTLPMSSASAPAASAAAPASDASSDLRTHKVVSGESLTTIARKEGTTIAALRTANNLKSDGIKVGQELKIPAGAGAAGTSSTASSSAASSPASASSSTAAGPGEYVVKSGDSPDTIAKKFGVKTSDLMSLNNISNPLRMQIGQKLKLPPNAKMPAAATSAPADATPAAATVPVVATPAATTSVFAVPSASTAAPPPATTPTDVAPVAVPVVPVSP